MVLEYAPNGNMFAFIRKRSKISEPELKKMFLQVCEAIAYMHKKKILHRDLKPENILLSEERTVKLCDFGWSAQCSKIRMTFCGTYEYMAPEIFAHKRYDERIDIWSLGVLLYELLHGYSPFKGESAIHIYKNMLKGECQFKQDIDPLAKDLISRILRVKPEDRISINDILSHKYFTEQKSRPPSQSPDLNLIKAHFKKPTPQVRAKVRSIVMDSEKSGISNKTSVPLFKKFSDVVVQNQADLRSQQIEKQLTDRARKQSVASIQELTKTAKRPVSRNSNHKLIVDFFDKINNHGSHFSSNSLAELRSRTKNLSLSMNKNIAQTPKPQFKAPKTSFSKHPGNLESCSVFKLTPSRQRQYYEILDQGNRDKLGFRKSSVSKKLEVQSTKHIKNIMSLVPQSPVNNKSGSIQSLKKFIESHIKKDNTGSKGSLNFKQRYFDKLRSDQSPSNKENVNYLATKNLQVQVDNPYYGPFFI